MVNVPSRATGDTIKYTLPNNVYYDDTVNLHLLLSTKIRDAVTNAIYYLYTLNYTPFATASGATTGSVGDSLLATFGAIVDTIVVGQVEAYDRYFATHPVTGKVIDLGRISVHVECIMGYANCAGSFPINFLVVQ
jgi:hypothetical protein